MRKKKRRRKSAKVIWFERISQSWIKICSMIKLYPQEKLIRQRNDAKRRTDQFRELQTSHGGKIALELLIKKRRSRPPTGPRKWATAEQAYLIKYAKTAKTNRSRKMFYSMLTNGISLHSKRIGFSLLSRVSNWIK